MELRALPADLEEVTLRDLNEDPARREQDVQHIRDWLAKQPHLTARTDTQWLTTFLRGCKFSLERTKEKLDMFYTLRTALPELFSNRDPKLPELHRILEKGNVLPLPEPDTLGRRVILWRNGLVDLSKVKLMDVMKANMMVMDLLLYEDDRAIICGTVSVMDHKESKASDIVHFSPSIAKKTSTVFQEGYPIRPKGMHHVNLHPAFTAIFNLFQSFMKEKIKRRIHLHSNMEEVFEHVPKRILPKEYGGEAGPIQDLVDKWLKKVEDHRKWYLEEEKYCSDEKKRPGGKPKTQEDLFGLEGSFRTLNVD